MVSLVVLAASLIVSYPFYRERQERIAARQRNIGSAVANGSRSLEAGDLLGSLPYFAEALRLHHEAHADEKADRIRLAGC
jgi:hypothetical protein